MRRVVTMMLAAAAVASSALEMPVVAYQSTAATIKVCQLLPRAEVKKLIGGNEVFDMIAPKEEALGNYGSSCNYPGVTVQVMTFLQSTLDAARTRGSLEPVAGVGDQAFLYHNPAGYAELYVQVGSHLLTLQRRIGMGQTIADVRAGTIALANALVAKLR
jgi:hypothetical protein